MKFIVDKSYWNLFPDSKLGVRIYVYLVEGYRENGKVKSRILKKYGYLDELEAQEPGIFEKLKKEAKEGKLVDKKILDVTYYNPETGEILPYSPIICIDQEKVDFDAQFDGINVLVTSEIDMSDERIE